MHDDPLITFVMPTTGRTTLKAAVGSVLSQSDPRWRLIVVGDGIVPYLDVLDERISLVGAEKTGSSGMTRNAALGAIETPWTGFLDDDDELHSGYVASLAALSAQRPFPGEPDVVVFKMDDPKLGVLPDLQAVIHGRIGISFAVKTSWFDHVRFVREDQTVPRNEDYWLLRLLEIAGATFWFSHEIRYYVKPHERA